MLSPVFLFFLVFCSSSLLPFIANVATCKIAQQLNFEFCSLEVCPFKVFTPLVFSSFVALKPRIKVKLYLILSNGSNKIV